MKATEFKVWQGHVDMSGREVADAFGKSQDTISAYRTKGVPKREEAMVRLACAAISAKLPPWYAK